MYNIIIGYIATLLMHLEYRAAIYPRHVGSARKHPFAMDTQLWSVSWIYRKKNPNNIALVIKLTFNLTLNTFLYIINIYIFQYSSCKCNDISNVSVKNNLTYITFTLIRVASHIINWAYFNAVLFKKNNILKNCHVTILRHRTLFMSVSKTSNSN